METCLFPQQQLKDFSIQHNYNEQSNINEPNVTQSGLTKGGFVLDIFHISVIDSSYESLNLYIFNWIRKEK